jgi:hypothetical protein
LFFCFPVIFRTQNPSVEKVFSIARRRAVSFAAILLALIYVRFKENGLCATSIAFNR